MPFEAIEVEGLRELNTALTELGRDIKKDLGKGLLVAAEPVRALAKELALEKISGVERERTVDWSSMRVGSSGALVYIAPTQRGVATGPKKRSNFADLLMNKAMEPALEQREHQVEAAAALVVEKAVRKAGF